MSSNYEIVPFQPTATSLVDIRLNAERFPRLKNVPQPVAVKQLASVVAMAFNYTGRAYDPETIALVAGGLYTELMADDLGIGTPNITTEEIGRAVRRAVLGEVEMYGINVSSLYKVVCNYATGEGHDAQVQANNRHAAERKKALDKSPVGKMLTAYAGEMLRKNNP